MWLMSKQPLRCLGADFSLSKLMHCCAQLRLLTGLSNNQSAFREKVSFYCVRGIDQPINSLTRTPPLCCHLTVPTMPRIEKGRKGQAEGDAWGREVGCRTSKTRYKVKTTGLRPGRGTKQKKSEDLCARATS